MEDTGGKAAPGGDLAAQLQSVLSDPERMGQLMQMASALAGSGALSGLMHDSAEGVETESLPAGTDARGELSPVPPAPIEKPDSGTKKGLPGGRHSELLRALRPYMSRTKQERIDRMLKLLQMAELADTMIRLQQ